MVAAVRVQRGVGDDHGTPGIITVGEQQWHLLELPWRNNRQRMSCIPANTYPAQFHQSAKFGSTIWIREIPNRFGVLMHSGNVAGDTDKEWMTHSLGCLLPGRRAGKLTVGGKQQRAVLSSRTAMREILTALRAIVGRATAFEIEIIGAK